MADILWHNETLFRNPEIFDFAYVPESFEHRGGQMQALADCIKPCFNKLKPINCKVSGESATGKTTSIKIVFDEAEKESSNVIFAHVNCSVCRNLYSLFSQIHKKVVGHSPPTSGFPLKEVYDNIMKKLASSKKMLITALDDAVYFEELNKAVYDLLRACEIFDVKVGVWLVGLPNEIIDLDSKTISVLSPHHIEFPKYTMEEIINILKKRAEYGLYAGVAQKQIIERIAQETVNKDLRFGIELLKSAVLEAENKSRKTVEACDVETSLRKFGIEKKSMIDARESVILNEIGSRMTSGELFDRIKDKMGISYTSFYRLVEQMKSKGLINVEEKSGEGRTRVIRKIIS